MTDPPLVYKDADGEVVTDLAFQTDFTDMVPNQHARLQEQFAKGSLDFDVTMADSEFKSAGTLMFKIYWHYFLFKSGYYLAVYYKNLTIVRYICVNRRIMKEFI